MSLFSTKMTSIQLTNTPGTNEKIFKKTQTLILLTEYDKGLALGDNKHNNAEYKRRLDRKHYEVYG